MNDEHLPAETEDLKTPMSFKVMVALAVIYLGWRLIQGIAWLIAQIG